METLNTPSMTSQEGVAWSLISYVLRRKASLLRVMLFLLAMIPILYNFVVIQYASITLPFWDHTELIHWISSWHDGSFRFSSLWEPHNHARPFVYRFVMVFNAVLTNWDIRSEYIYMYIALYSTIACHVWALHRVASGAVRGMVYPLVLLLVSLVLFSPVGHNNHWWSMMFQLNAANLFITSGFLVAFIQPQRWSSHVIAALSLWLATFTLTNGLFAVITVGIVFQLSATQLLRPSRWTLFWGANLLVLLAIYLPGIALSTSSNHPTLIQLVEFCLAYLGAPLGGLLWYPFKNMFDIPLSIMTNVVCGMSLMISCTLLCWHARTRLREKHSAALILFGFSIFALMSALVTSWGRAAFDEYGVAAGSSSRYTVFGAYLLIGQLYYLAAGFAHGWWNNARLSRIALTSLMVFVLLSMVSYGRALKIYDHAHNFNQTLVSAYPWGLEPTAQDKFIHHNVEFVQRLKRDLQRLELGPYNSRPFDLQKQDVGEFKKVGLLSEGRQIAQHFTANENGLKALGVTMVTPNGSQLFGAIEWQVSEVGSTKLLARGSVNNWLIRDWRAVRLKLPYLGDSKGREYQLTLWAEAEEANALAVAMYLPAANHNTFLRITEKSGISKLENLSMELCIEYAK